MPAAEAARRLERLAEDEIPPLQLVHSRYGLSLAFEDGELASHKHPALHRLGIRSCCLVKTSSREHPLRLGDRLTIWQGAFDREVYVLFQGKRTGGFDRASTRWVMERLANVSPLLSGTVIRADGGVRILVARNTTMGKLRGEKSILDGLI